MKMLFYCGILLTISLYAADDVKINLTDDAGTSKFAVQNLSASTVATINSQGKIISGNAGQVGKIVISDGSSNLITITAPAISGDWTLTLPTTDGASGQFLQTNGSGTTTWEIGSGWHCSTTRIKIRPRDFLPDYNILQGYGIYLDGRLWAKNTGETSGERYGVATIPIPTGYKATYVYVTTQNTGAYVSVYEGFITSAASAAKGSGNTNTEIDITDVDATDENYLVIRVHEDAGSYPDADMCTITGGYITIEKI